MFIYPHINPVAFHIGPVHVYWYGIMYIIGFFSAWCLAMYRVKRDYIDLTTEQVGDLIFYAALGVVIGGRVGYMLFYDFANFIRHPYLLFEVWHGGMAFHGGALGVLAAVWLYGRRQKKHFMDLMDFIVPFVPIGLGMGRIGNFINGELWGRITNVPWAMIYPHVDQNPRHPSEIYEFFMEGVVLFLILWFFSAKPRPRMAVSGMFALCYGVFRFTLEFFRQPDAPLGFIAFNWMTMGQLLSIPLALAGIIMLVFAYRNGKEK